MNALIGSGFFADSAADFEAKADFWHKYWLPNVGDRDVVIVDNSERPTPKLESQGRIRVIQAAKNLGHVGSLLGQFRPHLAGWSLSWILPALMAYSESRDFIYQEADCLAFGDWEQAISREMDERHLLAAFGSAASHVAECEQSLFFIRSEFITEFLWRYLSFPDGDGKMVPESKFAAMADNDFRIGRFSLGVGRMRPIDFEAKAFYAQKFTPDELAQLRERKLI